jgi:hypothetical protein
LYAHGGAVDDLLLELVEEIASVNIDELSAGAKESLYRTWYNNTHPVNDTVDYLTVCEGTHDDKIYCYDDRGLARKYYDSDRKHNVVNYSDLWREDFDDEDNFTLEEIAEMKGYQNSAIDFTSFNIHTQLDWKLENKRIQDMYDCLVDDTEKRIFSLLYSGYSKTDIAAILGFTKSKLTTQIKHIAEHLTTGTPKSSAETKRCRVCKEVLSLEQFGKDSRNRDGLQTICKPCDRQRKAS